MFVHLLARKLAAVTREQCASSERWLWNLLLGQLKQRSSVFDTMFAYL